MITHRNVVWLLALAFWIPGLAQAAGPAAGPLHTLQQQIDRLTRQYDDLAGRLTPPTLSHALSCVDAFLATIRLDISGNKEIAYYAVQEQGGNPPANFVTFVEPGRTTVAHQVNVEPGPATRTFLLVTGDTDGNVARAVLHVAPDVCFGPCPAAAICP